MTLLVGELRVHWLPKQEQIAPELIRAALHPSEWSEADSIHAPTRKDEYLRARYLLRKLTGFTDELPRRPAGDRSWPPGIVGSITHKDGHVGLCLADQVEYASVGIDAEDVARVRPELAAKICSDTEQAMLVDLAWQHGQPAQFFLALIFSFKEALFKSHYPLGGTMFYFHDAEITHLDPKTRTITARVLVPTSPRSPAGSLWHGSYLLVPAGGTEIVLTTTAVKAS